MTRSIKLAVTAALALGATSAFATNGDHLIGLGAKTRGMGGVGIGMSHGAESGLANPALISTVKGTEISFGGTLFMPKVAADMGAGSSDSDADMSMIPEVSIASKVGDNFFWGIGMWGTAGMGVDYREATGYQSNMNMVTNLQLMQFGVPLTYAASGFSIGIAPILQYGALDINYHMPTDNQGNYMNVGNGVAQDLSFGYNIGASFTMSGFTIGAVYKSPIEMEYKGQLSAATQPFVDQMIFPAPMDDKLEQPAEMGVGISYEMSGNTIALDYKKIAWSSAKGYEDFGWDDQSVISVGYQFAMDNWAARVGYNKASSPIPNANVMDPMMGYANAALNTFNALGFPATVESHISLGGTYAFSDRVSLDLAYVIAPEVSDTFNTPNQMDPTATTEVKHSQTSASFQLNYTF